MQQAIDLWVRHRDMRDTHVFPEFLFDLLEQKVIAWVVHYDDYFSGVIFDRRSSPHDPELHRDKSDSILVYADIPR